MSKTFYGGLSVGLLSGVWILACDWLSLMSFTAFFGWSTYYAAGGKFSGFKTTLISNFSGVLYGVVMILAQTQASQWVNGLVSLCLIVTLFAAMMVWQSKINLLAYVPGTFIGCSTYFSTGNSFYHSVAGLVIGACLGHVSYLIAEYWYNASQKRKAKA